jgi:uncharacterized protein (TIGR03435 family)
MHVRFPLAAFFSFSVLAIGQNPQFEVASVKVNNSGLTESRGDNSHSLASGRYTFINEPMRDLVMWAYKVRPEYIEGPKSLETYRFDIVAKAPPNTTTSDARRMLRALLADRFKLELKQDRKIMTVYALVSGKSGSQALTPTLASGGKVGCRPGQQDKSQIQVACTNITLEDLADLLPDLAPGYIDRPVVNLTDIQGSFDLKLSWAPRQVRRQETVEQLGDSTPDIATGPTIFAALDKQLGLKLVGQKYSMPTIVVRHFEQSPSEN